MFRKPAALALASLIVLTGCRSAPNKPVESVGGTDDVSAFVLRSLKGTRDGERLEVHAMYGDGSGSLTVRLHLNVTPPARLVSGTWTGVGGEGEVRQRSVTFLGGQSGPPSIGGRFELIGRDNRPLYRITIPLQELKHPIESQARGRVPMNTSRG
jgi:hypothetical protein